MPDTVDVVVFINEATETSIPLEIASKIDADDFSLIVCSFFEPDEHTFGLDVHSIDAGSQLDRGAYRRLYSLLKEVSPDVFHVHPNATGSVARVVAKMASVPNIVSTEHNTHEEFGYFKNLVNGGTNWLNDVVVCNSRCTADSFSNWEDALLKLSGTRKKVIYNGVDVVQIESAVEERDPPDLPDKFIFGTAARLVPQKNLEAIIKSVASLDRSQDIHTAIVGTGPEKENLTKLVQDLGIEDDVSFLGYLPERADVYAFFDAIDVFLFPSYYEGFGVAVVEAMATGTPVIVNDIPVMREVVGDAGLFVDATDTDELASVMEELYTNEEKRGSLGEQADQRAKNKFSLEKTVESYTSLYRGLVDR